MHIVLASDLAGVRTITLHGAVNSSVSASHLAAIVRMRSMAVCKAELSVSWPNPLQVVQFPSQTFGHSGVADVPKTAWQTASFCWQEGPDFGNFTLSSLIPGKMRGRFQ